MKTDQQQPESRAQENSLYADYAEGKKDSTGSVITAIFCRGDKYIIYDTAEKSLFKYQHGFDDAVTAPVEEKLFEVVQLLKTRNEKKRFRLSIASALKLCLEEQPELSKNYFDKISAEIKRYRSVKNMILYLLICIGIMTLCILGSLLAYYFMPSGKLMTRLTYISTAGSIGGFLSIAIRIKNLGPELFENRVLNFLSACIRMIFAILAGVVTYFLIESDIVFGFLKELEFNFYVVISLAIASGFSETRIPDLLKKLEEPGKTG